MDFTSLKESLSVKDSRGQAGMINMVILGGVAAVVTIIVITIFKKVNQANPTYDSTMDLVPTVLAMLLIIGLLAGAAYMFMRR